MLPDWFPEVAKYLPGANTAMAIVTVVVVQLLKFILPSPVPENPKVAVSRWAVIPQLKWAPLVATFLVACGLSLRFDPHVGQSFVGKLGDGLQTAAYAVISWEVYDNIVKPAVKKLFGN